jgi:hypothetical protein
MGALTLADRRLTASPGNMQIAFRRALSYILGAVDLLTRGSRE